MSRFATALRDCAASSSETSSSRIRSLALTSTGSVQQPAQQPSQRAFLKRTQVDGRWASGAVVLMERVFNTSVRTLALKLKGEREIVRAWLSKLRSTISR